MHKHPEVTPGPRAMLEKKFFGRLILLIGPRHSGGYLEGEESPSSIIFETNNIVDSGPKYFVFRTESMGYVTDQKWFCERGQIYTLVSKWEFHEYFSPLK
jgi:hypothetical protein